MKKCSVAILSTQKSVTIISSLNAVSQYD